jgi:multicomponent Na+:H+ antiporter subunit G
METLLDGLSWLFILGGVFFIVTGAIGVIRMPDIYCRLHAAGMTDTMGAGLILLGMCFQAGLTLITVRLLLIWLFLLVTSPVATHALARAALSGGVEPYRVPVVSKGGD